MIKGFDEQTQPLTEYEEKFLLPVVIAGLKTKRGAESAVTNTYIVSKLKPRYKVDVPRLRKIINHIRVNDLLPGLIATSNGYYLATSETEINDYVDSLRGREDAIRAVRIAMERQCRQLYRRNDVLQGELMFQ
jgi:hypothetical protein